MLQVMKPAGYEFQSDFARHYFAQGQAQGRAASSAELDEIGERLLIAQTLDEALGVR